MCISLENAKSDERDNKFRQMLRRRNELREIIKVKYPEVYEYLMTFVKESNWH